MQRVLSFQMARGIDESSEYVTKRLCFSFLFSVGFLCLLCGFLLGRFAAERSMEARMQKIQLELADNGLRNTEYLQQLALRELETTSFEHDRTIDWETSAETKLRRVNEFFLNLSFIDNVHKYMSCIRAIVRGSREPDRYVILSTNEYGIAMVLELAQILNKIHSAHDWRPRRSLIFCVSLQSQDVCPQALPSFIRRKVVAYVTVYGFTRTSDDYIVLSGSDVTRSIAIEAIKTVPGSNNRTYLEHETSGPRLPLDIPQNESGLAYNQTRYNQSLRSRDTTLAQMVSQTIWRLSESIVMQWKPEYFNETIHTVLESIDIDKSRDFKPRIDKLKKTLRVLLAAVKDLNTKIDTMDNTEMLRIRIWNDLLLDLDRALLCSDESSHSRTDLAILCKLSFESTEDTLTYLVEMAKCYENAVQLLKER